MDTKEKEYLGRGLALEAVIDNKIGQLTLYSGLDIERPETITNFNTFGLMLADAFLKGQMTRSMPVIPIEGHRADEYSGNTIVYGGLEVQPLVDTLEALREHITNYYLDLDARKHGGVAMDHAFNKIERALGMSWHEHQQKLKG